MIDKACEKCIYYNPTTELGCDYEDTAVRCSILNEYEKRMKFKGE